MAKNMKFYTVEKTINNKKYVAQFNGISASIRAVDETYLPNSNITSIEKMADYVLKNVIVEPKGLNIDDFESMEELKDVISFGRRVMDGNFRPEDDEGAENKEG